MHLIGKYDKDLNPTLLKLRTWIHRLLRKEAFASTGSST